ncbi:MAG: YciI family protein [Pseudomonadota bacterium]
MSYMLLIVEDPAQRSTRTPAEGEAVYERMVRFGQDLQARGVLVASESLSSHANAARVIVRAGKAAVVDGPFAEAKEMIGGFFLLSCKTWAEAMAIARQCPAAEWATVEVRSTGPCYDDDTDPTVKLH